MVIFSFSMMLFTDVPDLSDHLKNVHENYLLKTYMRT